MASVDEDSNAVDDAELEDAPLPEVDGDDDEMRALKKPVEYEFTKEDLELSAKEEKCFFRTKAVLDLPQRVLSSTFISYTIPEVGEGFDEVKFVWSDRPACNKRLHDFRLEKKISERMDDLVPSEWFRQRYNSWVIERESQRKKQLEHSQAEWTVALDVYIEDTDMPCFQKFSAEDWALLNLRVELHLLIHGFAHDVADAERRHIATENLAFYYKKYLNREFSPKYFGCNSVEEIIELLKDTVVLHEMCKCNVLVAAQPRDIGFDQLILKTEEARKNRKRSVDAGIASVALKFTIGKDGASKKDSASKKDTGPKRSSTQLNAPTKRARGRWT